MTAEKWSNISTLLANAGHITIGQVAHVEGAAIAADERTVFATLVRRPGESVEDLIGRLDQAIGLALRDGVYSNEVEGGHFEIAPPGRPRGPGGR